MSIRPAHPWRLVVLTKDSARWFGAILDAYQALGVSPFVILDSASSDETEDLLRRKRIDFAKETSEFPRAEALVGTIGRHIRSEWVVRLDDDELPTRALCDWVEAHSHERGWRVVGFERRWLRRTDGGACEYSRHPSIVSRLGVLDAQWRMFRPAEVRYRSDIHTPGFDVPKGSPIAPRRAYIAHLSWLVRSAAERRLQIDDYDRQTPGAGARFRDIKVWEDSGPADHRFRALDTEEFDGIAAALAHTTL